MDNRYSKSVNPFFFRFLPKNRPIRFPDLIIIQPQDISIATIFDPPRSALTSQMAPKLWDHNLTMEFRPKVDILGIGKSWVAFDCYKSQPLTLP